MPWYLALIVGLAMCVCGCRVRITTEFDPSLRLVPRALSYSRPVFTYTVGELAGPERPSVLGSIDRFEVTPELPSGLRMDPFSGIIAGRPTEVVEEVQLVVSAINQFGRAEVDLTIRVLSAVHPFVILVDNTHSTLRSFQVDHDANLRALDQLALPSPAVAMTALARVLVTGVPGRLLLDTLDARGELTRVGEQPADTPRVLVAHPAERWFYSVTVDGQLQRWLVDREAARLHSPLKISLEAQLGGMIVDASGRIAVTMFPAAALLVLHTIDSELGTLTPLLRIPLPGRPAAMVLDAARNRLAVAFPQRREVVVYGLNGALPLVQYVISTGWSPRLLAVDASGQNLLMIDVEQGLLARASLRGATHSITAQVQLPAVPRGVGVTGDRVFLFCDDRLTVAQLTASGGLTLQGDRASGALGPGLLVR